MGGIARFGCNLRRATQPSFRHSQTPKFSLFRLQVNRNRFLKYDWCRALTPIAAFGVGDTRFDNFRLAVYISDGVTALNRRLGLGN